MPSHATSLQDNNAYPLQLDVLEAATHHNAILMNDKLLDAYKHLLVFLGSLTQFIVTVLNDLKRLELRLDQI